MERAWRWVSDLVRGRPTPEEFEASVKQALAEQRELERKEMKTMRTQERLVRGIPRTTAEQSRLQREFKKYKMMELNLAQRSGAIARYESILHQITQYRETAQEAKLASAMPRMMELFDMPDVRTMERDMESMQQLVSDGMEVSSVVGNALSATTDSLAGPEAISIQDPMLLEDELTQFLAEDEVEVIQSSTTPSHTSTMSSSHAALVHSMPRVSKSSQSVSNKILNDALAGGGW